MNPEMFQYRYRRPHTGQWTDWQTFRWESLAPNVRAMFTNEPPVQYVAVRHVDGSKSEWRLVP